ncbi:hypothetical protein FD755_023519 [Muntiacus reevesi]|uniref:Choline/carnitine acyltransferase domain-containing protein n=1 Tax=Muntiacus reevesi TaxID=9886 RepID=A0A5N3VX59_MUNRE|nr:hypothetical protein FD755_023519 [Muntiacus reevesi]
MENQLAKSTEERTFQYQDSLPSLPVPSLEESLKKYLESVKPFANEEEYKNTEAIVRKFQNGIGEKLQQKLLQRAKGKRNWLEEWWLNVAYLDVRIPSQLNVNFGGPTSQIEHYWPPKEGTQLERGSISLWHNLNYWQLLRKEKLAVEKIGNVPLDMNQFRMLFSTCKIPGITRDSIINYFRTESEGHSPSHVAVLCRGRVFVFDVMHEGYVMTAPEIQRFHIYTLINSVGFSLTSLCMTDPRLQEDSPFSTPFSAFTVCRFFLMVAILISEVIPHCSICLELIFVCDMRKGCYNRRVSGISIFSFFLFLILALRQFTYYTVHPFKVPGCSLGGLMLKLKLHYFAVLEGSIFFHSHQHLLLLAFLMVAILESMKANILILIEFSLSIPQLFSTYLKIYPLSKFLRVQYSIINYSTVLTFSCTSWSFLYLLWRNVCSIPSPILKSGCLGFFAIKL